MKDQKTREPDQKTSKAASTKRRIAPKGSYAVAAKSINNALERAEKAAAILAGEPTASDRGSIPWRGQAIKELLPSLREELSSLLSIFQMIDEAAPDSEVMPSLTHLLAHYLDELLRSIAASDSIKQEPTSRRHSSAEEALQLTLIDLYAGINTIREILAPLISSAYHELFIGNDTGASYIYNIKQKITTYKTLTSDTTSSDGRREARRRSELPDPTKSAAHEDNRLDAQFRARASKELVERVDAEIKARGLTKKEAAAQMLQFWLENPEHF